MWSMVLCICERLSAKSCRLDYVANDPGLSVNVFQLSRVDYVANGPGYL